MILQVKEVASLDYKKDNMSVSNIMIKKELENLQGKIKSQDENKIKIDKIVSVLSNKVTIINYSDKIKLIRDILSE